METTAGPAVTLPTLTLGPLDEQIAQIRDPGQLFQGAWSLMRAHVRSFVVPLILFLILFQTGLAGSLWYGFHSLTGAPSPGPGGLVTRVLGLSLITGLAAVLLFLMAGMGWLAFQHTLETGEIRQVWQFAGPVLRRFFPYLFTWFWFFLWVFCGLLLCLVPGWIAMALWAPAPFLALQRGVGPIRAMQLAARYTRVRVPQSRYARTGWGKLIWLIGGVQILQACLSQSITLAAQLIQVYLLRKTALAPASIVVISQIAQIPVQIINGVSYALLLAGAILVLRQGVLYRHAPDLHARMDIWLESLRAS